jgi:hypothetical protein
MILVPIRAGMHLLLSVLRSGNALIVLLGLCCLCACGCSRSKFLERAAPQGSLATANHYIDSLRQGKIFDVEFDVDPSIWNPNVHKALVRMASAIPSGDPISKKLVGVNTDSSAGVSETGITFEYEFPRQWLLINVVTRNKGGQVTITGFRVNAIPDSLEHANRFRMGGKGGRYYLVLALAVFMPLFSLYALVRCLRANPLKRKWLWIAFILVGFSTFSLNWSSGLWSFRPLSVQLFSASAFQPLYGPWSLSVSLPVGAIVFLILRRRLTKPAGALSMP